MVLPTPNILVVGHPCKSLNGHARVDGGTRISVGTSSRWTIRDRRRWEILGETCIRIKRIGSGNNGRRPFRSHTHGCRNCPDGDVGKRRTGNRGHRQFLIIRGCNTGCRIGCNDFGRRCSHKESGAHFRRHSHGFGQRRYIRDNGGRVTDAS